MWVVIIIFVSALAAFLFHFTTLSSYERQVSSIIQTSKYIPSYQSQINPTDSTSQRIADLDKKYGYDFMIKPAIHNPNSNDHMKESGYTDDSKASNNHNYENGERMYYMIEIKIPYMSVGRTYVDSTHSYDGHTGVKLIHKASFENEIPEKTICQTSNDNNENQAQINRDS